MGWNSRLLPVLLVLGCPVFAQSPPSGASAPAGATTAPQGPTFKSGANLVSLNVSVLDSGSRYVNGLQASDFAVYEDGVKQDVQFFESESVPIDLIVLVDTSASMGDKMDVVRDAATGFLKTLRPCDRGAVVAFDDTVRVLQPFTSDRAVLEKAVRSTVAHGATSLYNAVYIALKQFGQQAKHEGEVRRQAIAVLSDGDDTASLVSFDDVMAVARRSGVSIYPIGLQSRREGEEQVANRMRRYYSEAEFAMKTMAQETGAKAYFPQLVTELKGIYGGIATELSNQYSIGYAPSNVRSDGRFRRIVVQVVGRPELRPRTRLGYIAEPVNTRSITNNSGQR